MYAGRIVSAGVTDKNCLCLMYRVSSRSFPNRVIKSIRESSLSVIPAAGSESDINQNPYISYNCLRHNHEFTVVGNGTHTDPIFEKLESGMNIRDSLISSLFGLDYEHDDYSTPRIAAVACRSSKTLALGIIRYDGMEVEMFNLEPGTYRYVSTYEMNHLSTDYAGTDFNPANPKDASKFIIDRGKFANFQNPVSSAAAIESDSGFDIEYINLRVGS